MNTLRLKFFFFFSFNNLLFQFTDYPDYSNNYSTSYNEAAVKYEDEHEEKYRIPDGDSNGRPDQTQYNNYESAQDY